MISQHQKCENFWISLLAPPLINHPHYFHFKCSLATVYWKHTILQAAFYYIIEWAHTTAWYQNIYCENCLWIFFPHRMHLSFIYHRMFNRLFMSHNRTQFNGSCIVCSLKSVRINEFRLIFGPKQYVHETLYPPVLWVSAWMCMCSQQDVWRRNNK